MNNKITNYYVDLIICSSIWGLVFAISALYLLFTPDFTFKNELWLNDIINIFLALFLAIVLPRSIWKVVENKKNAKQLLLDDCAQLLNSWKEILDYIKENCDKQKPAIAIISKPDSFKKNHIVLQFKWLWNKVTSLKEMLEIEFWEVETHNFFKRYSEYNIAVTDMLMNKKFRFTHEYYSNAYKVFINFETAINNIKFKINKL